MNAVSDAVQAYEEFLEKEWPALLSSTSTKPDHGIHMWHEPMMKTLTFTALIEGPPNSPFEGVSASNLLIMVSLNPFS